MFLFRNLTKIAKNEKFLNKIFSKKNVDFNQNIYYKMSRKKRKRNCIAKLDKMAFPV